MESEFFEGAEKLLEVWWAEEGGGSLLGIPEAALAELCEVAGCQILSRLERDEQRSYVLSESSLLLSPRRLILKTCGRTHLLRAAPLARELAAAAGLHHVESVFYSRKNFLRPELQPEEYRDGDLGRESRALDRAFGREGTAYCMGALNRERWYLYCVEGGREGRADLTLEVLMWELDGAVRRTFSAAESATAEDAAAAARLPRLFPKEALVDDFLFRPSGYSANVLVPASHSYATVHVTPQAPCSYASFEANFVDRAVGRLLGEVLESFRPARCVLSLYSNAEAQRKWAGLGVAGPLPDVPGFASHHHHNLTLSQRSRILFAHYQRLPSPQLSPSLSPASSPPPSP